MTSQPSVAELETHRAALTGHCYRMLGSPFDAEDAVQETMVRAWKNLGRFEGRSAVRTWLYRIATNVCLDALAHHTRRSRPVDEGPAGTVDDPLEAWPSERWIEPVPEDRILSPDADPYERASLRQHVRLAFVSALQHLPPRQRAAILLADVLGWSSAEIAECLETTTPAINSALQRARATLAAHDAAPDAASRHPELSDEQRALLERYVDTFQRYDVDGLVSLLREDVAFSMPPYPLWLRGPEAVRGWLHGRGIVCRGSRLEPVAASGAPAFAQYHPDAGGGFSAWAIIVLELDGPRIASWTSFLDTASLFPIFNLPLVRA
ncbi:MAG: sigma-70 family RNA polymerase sigma factor [Vicinamibacterales bacterium]